MGMLLDRRSAILGVACLAAAPGALGERRSTQEVMQGALVRARVAPGSRVYVDSKELRVAADGLYVFGIARDRRHSVKLRIVEPGCSSRERILAVQQREYAIEHIDQLPGEMVTPNRKALARIERENRQLLDARSHDSNELWFARPFIWPLRGRLTGKYGSRRILNGSERRPHFGVDIAAPDGAPVVAPQAAIVRLAERDFYFSGGTIVLDHGYGVFTTYLHMSRLSVEVGQFVEIGRNIGAVGKTGRATGPHLCWRLNWFGERLDASLVAPKPTRNAAQAEETAQDPLEQEVQACSGKGLVF